MAAYVWVTLLIAVTAAARGIFSPCGLSMISAINPFSERARGHRYWLTAAWFVLGSMLGGAALGGVAAIGAAAWQVLNGSVSAGLTALTAVTAAVCCLIAVASDSAAFAFRLPSHPRQVNENWFGSYRRWAYAAGFGFQIGAGVATYIMTAAVYLTAALGVLSGSPLFALAVGLVFGLVRGLAVLISSGARDPAALRRLHFSLDRLAPWSLRTAMLMQALAAGVFGYLAGGLVGLGVVVVAALLGGVRIRSARRSAVVKTDPMWLSAGAS